MQPLRKLKKWFFNGPSWLPLPPLITESKYRSVTLVLAFWLYALYVRQLSAAGRIILPAGAVVGFYSLLLTSTPVSTLTFPLGALFVMDLGFGLLLRPRLKLKRHAPGRTAAGTPTTIVYDLTNRGRLPCLNLKLDAIGLPRELVFANRKNPTVNIVLGRQTVTLECELTPSRRGAYRLPPPLAQSSFPFGLTHCHASGEGRGELLAYPAFHELAKLELPLKPRGYVTGNAYNAFAVGDSPEFAACREFQPGDDPRRIHWPATARLGAPIVKECQDEHTRRIGLLLETYARPLPRKGFPIKRDDHGPHPAFEAALALAAAVTDYCERNHYQLELFAAGRKVYQFHEDFTASRLDRVLDLLARTPMAAFPISCYDDAVMDELNELNAVVYITPEPALAHLGALKQLLESDIPLKAIGVGTAAAGALSVVSPQAVLAGEVRAL